MHGMPIYIGGRDGDSGKQHCAHQVKRSLLFGDKSGGGHNYGVGHDVGGGYDC